MEIIQSKNIKKKFLRSVVAIGNFDGVHLGHQKLFKIAKKISKRNKTNFGIISFKPLPYIFFNKIDFFRLNSDTQKVFYLKKNKVNYLLLIKFNKAFSNLNAVQFIKKIIFSQLKAKYVIVSKNFLFGKNRTGNIKTLKQNEKNFNYKTIVVAPKKKGKHLYSSSWIRKLINNGKIELANKMLGRKWSVVGKVIKGKQQGRLIGFPTCNISYKEYVLPKFGVYSVNILVKEKKYKGIANLGVRPTINGKKILLEAHLFGFKQNLYNKEITVEFNYFVRNEKKFKSLVHLKNQIKKDIIKVKKYVKK